MSEEKDAIYKKEAEIIMQAFTAICPLISWDRYTSDEEGAVFYGWIPRGDGSRDFILYRFEWNDLSKTVGTDLSSQSTWLREVLPRVRWYTSSAKYSAMFCKLISGPEYEHSPCKKILGAFSLPVVNTLS